MSSKEKVEFLLPPTAKKLKVYCAMSGGVDSSVSAALLKSAGFDVVGVYMRQWVPSVLTGECIWKQDRQDAMMAAAKIGIPFLTWDFSEEYEKEVGQYMINSYKKGITPNPDVMCNKVIKFGYFFDKAMEEGADFVATGHYASNGLSNKLFSDAGTRFASSGKSTWVFEKFIASPLFFSLLKAKDKNKDQTYFLYEIKKEQLPKIIFPIGGLEKSEVRKLAKKFGLENAEKKDSQGVCFIGQFNMKNFLRQYIKPRIGKIIELKTKKEIGNHDGVYYYTIGQRHGLNITNGKGPYFIVKKDIAKNIIYVGKEKDLLFKKVKIEKIHWIEKPAKFPVLIDVRTRYRAPLKKAKLNKNGGLVFVEGDKAVTSGQSAVFYKGSKVLGGGIIK